MAEYIEREAVCAACNNGEKSRLCSVDCILHEIPAADVVSRAAFDQVMWERDTAMEQLKEHGIPFG